MKIGDRVRFVVGRDIEALVTGIQTSAMSHLYRVGWFHNGEYKEGWFYEFEVESVTGAKTEGSAS